MRYDMFVRHTGRREYSCSPTQWWSSIDKMVYRPLSFHRPQPNKHNQNRDWVDLLNLCILKICFMIYMYNSVYCIYAFLLIFNFNDFYVYKACKQIHTHNQKKELIIIIILIKAQLHTENKCGQRLSFNATELLNPSIELTIIAHFYSLSKIMKETKNLQQSNENNFYRFGN